ncbi:MAG: SCO family protein [Opitutaceae bacterium]|nr:SCO family protein [Opitutaceae bacterium]
MIYLRLILCLAGLFAISARAEEPAACCAETPAEETPLTPRSLYQLGATFTNDRGEAITLAQFRGRPVVLTMFFASCGYACPLLVSDMTRIQDALPPDLGDTTAYVLVSFDTKRDTPAALARYRADRELGPQWHLLHGDDDAVSELAALLGVKYRLEANGMFAHSNLITVLNREGEIVHRRNGLQGGLEAAAQALTAASTAP